MAQNNQNQPQAGKPNHNDNKPDPDDKAPQRAAPASPDDNLQDVLGKEIPLVTPAPAKQSERKTG
ncbi:MAG: hypothetical protein AB7E29_14150 [Xanthobacter sp.]